MTHEGKASLSGYRAVGQHPLPALITAEGAKASERSSAQAYRDVYGLPPEQAPVPFSQPGLVTIPLAFLVLVVASLLTQPKGQKAIA